MKKRIVLALGLVALAVVVQLRRERPTPALPPPARPAIEEQSVEEIPSPPAPVPLEVDAIRPVPDRVPELLPLILAGYAKGMMESATKHDVMTRFAVDLRWKRRELRLLARAYPDVAARLATRIATDRSADEQRYGAIVLLGMLAEEGRKDAESELVGIILDPYSGLAQAAIKVLAEADEGGAHRALYRDLAFTYAEAARALPYWPDPASEARLNLLAERGGFARTLAGIVLRDLELLSSGQGLRTMMEFVENPAKDAHRAPWAFKAARVNAVPGLLDALRKRLDVTERAAAGLNEEEWERSTILLTRHDVFFDDALVAYHRMGGKLSELEAKRLRYFGYAGDPKERLEEVYPRQR